jgi:hypothetical protein
MDGYWQLEGPTVGRAFNCLTKVFISVLSCQPAASHRGCRSRSTLLGPLSLHVTLVRPQPRSLTACMPSRDPTTASTTNPGAAGYGKGGGQCARGGSCEIVRLDCCAAAAPRAESRVARPVGTTVNRRIVAPCRVLAGLDRARHRRRRRMTGIDPRSSQQPFAEGWRSRGSRSLKVSSQVPNTAVPALPASVRAPRLRARLPPAGTPLAAR